MITAERKAEVIKIILERIADGESLLSILPFGNDLVSTVLFYAWLKEDSELFNDYERAREARADKIFEEIIIISNEELPTESETSSIMSGSTTTTYDNVQRSKLKIDARKWMLSKMMPKKYGEKLDIEHTHVEQPLFSDKSE